MSMSLGGAGDSGEDSCTDRDDADGIIAEAPCGAVANQSTAAASGNDGVDEYCRFGCSAAGLRHFASQHAIDPEATTSDVCHTMIKPATVPSGWDCKPTLVNPEKGWYDHEYEESATGIRQNDPPPGTTSYCQAIGGRGEKQGAGVMVVVMLRGVGRERWLIKTRGQDRRAACMQQMSQNSRNARRNYATVG